MAPRLLLPPSVKLFLCGDVMLGRGIDQILPDPCDPELHESYMTDARGYIEIAEQRSGPIPRGAPADYPWGEALAILDAARPDARIVNLETAITRSGDWDRDKGIHYRVSPENAASLRAARVDACNLGNNHVLDWGPGGLLDTLSTLDALGVAWSGAGRDLDEATRPAVIELGAGRRIEVFSIGVADAGVPPWWQAGPGRPGVHALVDLGAGSMQAVRRAIERWHVAPAVIVVSIHWGPNWGFSISADHRRFARGLIDDAGVHVVHGHSSHHVKAIEVHHGQPILYGCGDLITDYEGIGGHEAFRGELGLLYLVSLDDRGALAELELVPTRMHRFRLVEGSAEDARWLAAVLTRAGAAVGASRGVSIAGRRLFLRG
ncbi:MAG: CapA family protein [Kofleriaceae bacterium]